MADFVVDFIKFKEENNKDIKNGDKDGIINDLNKEVIRLDNENKNLKNKIYELQNNNNNATRPSSNLYETIPENILCHSSNNMNINFEDEYKDLLFEYENLKQKYN